VNSTAHIAGATMGAPALLELAGAFPQPSRGAATIRFALPAPSRVSLRLYDLHGRIVWFTGDATYGAGVHDVRWNGCAADATPLPSGVYFLRLGACGTALTRRVTMVH
jgi:hypothetical protein